MSRVTSIAIIVDCGDYDMRSINHFMENTLHREPFKPTSESAGGGKGMQFEIYAAAYNHLSNEDLALFVDYITRFNWNEYARKTLHVFVQGEHDEEFTIYKYEGKPWGK